MKPLQPQQKIIERPLSHPFFGDSPTPFALKRLKIWTESVGDPQNPPILLIAGAGAPSTYWFDGFFMGLAAAGYYVIRYDNRDCGFSTHLPVGQNMYTIHDLVEDAEAVLAAYGLGSKKPAHIIGHSMGGHIVQTIGINKPQLAQSLVIISATDGIDPQVPPIDPDVLKSLTLKALTQDFRQDLPRFMALWKDLHGTRPIDEDLAIAFTQSLYNRHPKVQLAVTHMAALATIGYIREQLPLITQRTLILHGDQDTVQSIEGAKIIATQVPKSSLSVLQGAGHLFFSYALWKEILDAVLAHLRQV